MALKLQAPDQARRHPYWRVRGELEGVRVDRTTGVTSEEAAETLRQKWERQIIRGEYCGPNAPEESAVASRTFRAAAIAYLYAGGDPRFMSAIIDLTGPYALCDRLLADIDQIALDSAAAELYPNATPATVNRQFYTPVSAVLKRAGIERRFKRPRGWQGKKSTSWLEPDQAFALFEAADRIEPEFGLFCRFLCYTGMRLSEALGVTLHDLKIERAYVYLPDSKTGEPRGCHLPPVLVEALQTQPARIEKPLIERGQKGFILGGGGRPMPDAGVPFLERAPKHRLFRYHASGFLRGLLQDAMAAAGLSFPRRQCGFHIFCHTYGSWMHRYGKLDTHGLTRTGRWADADSADRYVHTGASEEARRSDLLPTPPCAPDVRRHLKIV